MELSQFLHIETRKCSWFAHWWMQQHHEEPDKFPLNLEPGEWDEQFRAWEEIGCPNPNNPGILYSHEPAGQKA